MSAQTDSTLHIPEFISMRDVDSVMHELDVTHHGLTSSEASRRLTIFGTNELAKKKKSSILVEILSRFLNPLLIVLLVVSIASYLLGQYLDATIIIVMVLMSGILNYLQEHKAGKAADTLLSKVSLHVQVLRDGTAVDIHAARIVPGDIVQLNAGDVIPADCRIIEAKDFFVNQSSLTGESFPVEKNEQPIVSKGGDLSHFTNMVFMGTAVVTGTATVVVVKTGIHTELGLLASSLTHHEENEFTKGISHFSNFILRIIIVFVFAIFFVNALVKQDIFQSLLFAIAVAVGLTPEFLPMIMSVTMAKGSVAMAKKGVIVKKLTAIPSFGSMDILCTDKTGTLTQNKIQLVKYINLHGETSETVLHHAYMNSYFETGISNPLDDALRSYKHIDIGHVTKLDEIPFDFERKKLSVVVKDHTHRTLITKGAPEEILTSSASYERNGHIHHLTPKVKEEFHELYNDLSKDGFRVLAVATKDVGSHRTVYTKHDESELIILGFVAFLDPVKTQVKEAIDTLEKMGIEIKVITGDNEFVAQKICVDAGVNVKGLVLSHEITHISDEALLRKAEKASIFARFSPTDKSRLIGVLKKSGHVVGYLGDGINDAPSLEIADVGISVSNAVDVAKESADMILTHKSLHELVDGVVEGRKIFGNTMKYIMMGLSSNFGNMFSLLGAVVFLPFLPMLPIQILLNNFLYDFSQITVPADNVDPEYIEKPKRWNMHNVKNFMFVFGPISSIFDFLSFFILYRIFAGNPQLFQTGWFMESLATQALVIHVIRTKKIPFIQSRPSPVVLISSILIVTVGWLIPFSPLGPLFQFQPLPLSVVGLIAVIVLSYLLFAEAGKRVYYRYIIQES